MHVWRLNAYYMGVDDIANLVKDSGEKTIKLLQEVGYLMIIPAVLRMNKTSIIMGKNLAGGLFLDYYVAIYEVAEGKAFPNCPGPSRPPPMFPSKIRFKSKLNAIRTYDYVDLTCHLYQFFIEALTFVLFCRCS